MSRWRDTLGAIGLALAILAVVALAVDRFDRPEGAPIPPLSEGVRR